MITGFLIWRAFRKVGGFTLIEILVILSIVAILASLLIPAISRAKKNNRTYNPAAIVREYRIGETVIISGISKTGVVNAVEYNRVNIITTEGIKIEGIHPAILQPAR